MRYVAIGLMATMLLTAGPAMAKTYKFQCKNMYMATTYLDVEGDSVNDARANLRAQNRRDRYYNNCSFLSEVKSKEPETVISDVDEEIEF